jgi:hypothetical protein
VTTGGSVAAAQGDSFVLGYSQTNGSPTIKSSVMVRCI